MLPNEYINYFSQKARVPNLIRMSPETFLFKMFYEDDIFTFSSNLLMF
jgi:hypothetical protein